MTRHEIIRSINEFLIEEIEIEEELIPEADLRKDLGIDSLDFVDIVVIVEKTFGFKIKGEELKDVKTLAEFYNYVEERVQK
jgi:acyl carrier protein